MTEMKHHGSISSTNSVDADLIVIGGGSAGFAAAIRGHESGAKVILVNAGVIGEPAFVYTAAYEGRLAAENALDGNNRKRDYTALGWVIFTDPQVAGVGINEKAALRTGAAVFGFTFVGFVAPLVWLGIAGLVAAAAWDLFIGRRAHQTHG